MTVRLPLVVLALAVGPAACASGGERVARSPDPAPLPAARRWVAMGQTNSIAGPRATYVALRGKAPAHGRGDTVVVVSAARARRLFALVRGSRRIGRPSEPQNCADCGASYTRADGSYFVASKALLREFDRLVPG